MENLRRHVIGLSLIGLSACGGGGLVGEPENYSLHNKDAGQLPPPLNWATMDDVANAGATAIAKTPSGNLLAAGELDVSTPPMHAGIRQSADSGSTWALVDDFSSTTKLVYVAIASDAAGSLYTVTGGGSWIVRQSLDGGLTWATVDTVAGSGQGLAIDAFGNVYVVG